MKIIFFWIIIHSSAALAQICPDIVYPEANTYNEKIGTTNLIDANWVIRHLACIGEDNVIIGGVVEMYGNDVVIRIDESRPTPFNVIKLDREGIETYAYHSHANIENVLDRYCGTNLVIKINRNIYESNYMYTSEHSIIGVLGD